MANQDDPSEPRSEGIAAENLQQAGARLLREAEEGAPLPSDSDPSITSPEAGATLPRQQSHMSDESHVLAGTPEQHKRRGCARRMKEHFKVRYVSVSVSPQHSPPRLVINSEHQHWETSQKEILIEAIVDGKLTGNDTQLRVNEPRPSVREQYGPDSVVHHLRRAQAGTNSKGQPALNSGLAAPQEPSTTSDDVSQLSSNQSLMRVFSVIFALE